MSLDPHWRKLLCLIGALSTISGASAAQTSTLVSGADSASVTARFEIFPRGTLFPSLVASLREPQLRNSLLFSTSDLDLGTMLGLTEQGASIALWRRNGRAHGDGLEFGIQGSASAQFDLESSKWTLLNADYTFSYPLTYRRGATAARFRYYHVSSHLGDRYLLLRPEARRFNNSGFRREAVELMVARTFGDSARSLVGFGGGEYAYSVTPKDMKRGALRAGADVFKRFHEFGKTARASWVAGSELTFTQDRDWAMGVSVRAGYEIGRATGEDPGGRRYRMLAEFYNGPATFGHFSRVDNIRYFGFGCYVIP